VFVNMGDRVTEPTKRRRQARGRRRIEAILDAAEGVFGAVGYEAATTNAIAAASNISPGSLYQYFANKEAIAAALEDRYAAAVQAAHTSAAADPAIGSLEDAIGRLVDDVIAHATATPAFRALFAERPMPDHLASSTRALHAASIARVRTIVDRHVAGRSDDDRARIATVAVHLCRSLTPPAVAAVGTERAALVTEMKRVLGAYLAAAAG
jgi:AcrR family transcriptional regulator